MAKPIFCRVVLHTFVVVILFSSVRAETSYLRAGDKFGPAFHADPGSWTGFSTPESELDGSTNLECPYPPCRQLRNDLLTRQAHLAERSKLLKEDIKNEKLENVKSEVERDDSLKPSPLNIVEGGAVGSTTGEPAMQGQGRASQLGTVALKPLVALPPQLPTGCA